MTQTKPSHPLPDKIDPMSPSRTPQSWEDKWASLPPLIVHGVWTGFPASLLFPSPRLWDFLWMRLIKCTATFLIDEENMRMKVLPSQQWINYHKSSFCRWASGRVCRDFSARPVKHLLGRDLCNHLCFDNCPLDMDSFYIGRDSEGWGPV